jgi:NNP family nitrate/nitrite transporter-like MFS transporter
MVGAYGTVGAVVFLTVLSFVSPQVFFMVIACTAAVTLVAAYLFLEKAEAQSAVGEQGAGAVAFETA